MPQLKTTFQNPNIKHGIQSDILKVSCVLFTVNMDWTKQGLTYLSQLYHKTSVVHCVSIVSFCIHVLIWSNYQCDNKTGSSKGYFLLQYMSEPILLYFNSSEKALQPLPVFLNMNICTLTWVKDACTFAISALLSHCCYTAITLL